MEWSIELNDQMSINVVRDDDGLFYVSCYPAELARIISYKEINDRFYLEVHPDIYAYIDLTSNQVKYLREPYTTVEIRSLYENLKEFVTLPSVDQQAFIESRHKPHTGGIETELHTHFLEMLTGSEFINLISQYIDYVPARGDQVLGVMAKGEKISDFPMRRISSMDIEQLAYSYSIGIDGQVPFKAMEEISARRTVLITLAAMSMASNPDDFDEVAKYRAILYIKMLEIAMNTLKNKGIKYVEFSYSTAKTIMIMHKYFQEHPEEIKGIDFKVLYSFGRTPHKDSKVNKAMRDFEDLVNSGYVKGFDLMGEEHGLTLADRDDIHDPKTFVSIVNNVLRILDGKKDKVLRLHAGENADSKNNPLESLMIIDKLVTEFGYDPPQIRIGHGLYFFEYATLNGEYSAKYEDLLKKYNVIVEINATSNYTLTSITSLKQIPYRWYTEHGIPIVLATDGAGMYLTDAIQERIIAEIFGGQEVLINVSNTEDRVLGRC